MSKGPKQSGADEVRTQLAQRGISEEDVIPALSWARRIEAQSPAIRQPSPMRELSS